MSRVLPVGLIVASVIFLFGLAFSAGVQLGYGFVFMMFAFPLQALLGTGEVWENVIKALWWLIPALPGILGVLMLLKGRTANG